MLFGSYRILMLLWGLVYMWLDYLVYALNYVVSYFFHKTVICSNHLSTFIYALLTSDILWLVAERESLPRIQRPNIKSREFSDRSHTVRVMIKCHIKDVIFWCPHFVFEWVVLRVGAACHIAALNNHHSLRLWETTCRSLSELKYLFLLFRVSFKEHHTKVLYPDLFLWLWHLSHTNRGDSPTKWPWQGRRREMGCATFFWQVGWCTVPIHVTFRYWELLFPLCLTDTAWCCYKSRGGSKGVNTVCELHLFHG